MQRIRLINIRCLQSLLAELCLRTPAIILLLHLFLKKYMRFTSGYLSVLKDLYKYLDIPDPNVILTDAQNSLIRATSLYCLPTNIPSSLSSAYQQKYGYSLQKVA